MQEFTDKDFNEDIIKKSFNKQFQIHLKGKNRKTLAKKSKL